MSESMKERVIAANLPISARVKKKKRTIVYFIGDQSRPEIIKQLQTNLTFAKLTILSIFEAGGWTLVLKKSCSITILAWTRLSRVEISLLGNLSPYNRGPGKQNQVGDVGNKRPVLSLFSSLLSNFQVSVLGMDTTTTRRTSSSVVVFIVLSRIVGPRKLITVFMVLQFETPRLL